MNGDGMKLVLVGIILAIVSTLFAGTEFIITFWTEDIVDYFTNIGDIFSNIADYFDLSIYLGLAILSILVFVIGLLLSIIGLKNFISFIGGLLLLYSPIVLILILVDAGSISDILSLDYLSTYLLLVGGILCMIGGIKNKD